MELRAADLKVAHTVHLKEKSITRDPQVTLSARSGSDAVEINGTLTEVREAVRNLAAALGMIATVPQPGDRITARTPEVCGRTIVKGFYAGGSTAPARSLAFLVGDNNQQQPLGLETAELVARAPRADPHDYEPGDTTHPMSTDPDCRACGQTRRACEKG